MGGSHLDLNRREVEVESLAFSKSQEGQGRVALPCQGGEGLEFVSLYMIDGDCCFLSLPTLYYIQLHLRDISSFGLTHRSRTGLNILPPHCSLHHSLAIIS